MPKEKIMSYRKLKEDEVFLEKEHVLFQLRWQIKRLQEIIVERGTLHFTRSDIMDIEDSKNDLEIIFETLKRK